jgi:hypothetical protein
MTVTKPTQSSRISLPVKVGLVFAAVAVILAVVGIARGVVPANPLSITLALLTSGGSWFVVSWAVTTAVVDVEGDLAAPAVEASQTANGAQGSADDGK